MSKADKINKPETMRKVVDATKVKKIVAGTLITATLMGSTTGVFADSKYENLDYLGEGYISVAEEVGPQGNGGFISSGVGDAGGISYGMLQLTSKAGGASANKFAFTYLKNEHPTYYKFFEGVGKAGTKSFSDAWTKAYNHNPGEFEKIQLDYKDITYVKPAVQLVKDAYGIDLLSSRARTEWVHATSVQFGPGGVKEVVGKAGVNNDMDDVELISKLSQEKRDSVGTYKFLGCSQSVRKSVYNRFNREEKEMIKIAKEEAGDSLEDVLKEEVKKDEEVVTAIETDDVVIDIVDDKTDTSDEKVEDTEKEETMEDESILDDSKDEDVNEDDSTTGGDEPDNDEMEDESIIDEEDVNNDENVDEDNSIVDEEEVNNENIDEDDSIVESEESDTDKVDTEENTDGDNSVVDEEVDTDEDIENVEGDNSVVDDSVLEDKETDNNDNSDKDDSIESEDTENKTESEDKENSEVEKEESVENETMEDESIIDDSNIEDTESNNDKAEDTSDKAENDKVDQSDEDANNTNTNVEEDKLEEVKEDTNSDNSKVEDVEKEDVNTDDSTSENETDAEEDKSEKVDTEEEKVETKEEVKTDKEVEDTKAESTQEEVKEDTPEKVQEDAQDEVKEETQNDETQNDNNEQHDNQADVKVEPTQTEQVVAMSDSEARIQELQAKLEGNLFQNMFSKLSV